MKTPEPVGEQGRWLDLLAEYDITIQHRLGRVHGNSGALSRRPCDRDGEMDCRQCKRHSTVALETQTGVFAPATSEEPAATYVPVVTFPPSFPFPPAEVIPPTEPSYR